LHAGGVKKSGAVPPPSPLLGQTGTARPPPPRRRSRSSSQPLRDRDAGRGKASRRPSSTAASLPLLSAAPPAYPRPARARPLPPHDELLHPSRSSVAAARSRGRRGRAGGGGGARRREGRLPRGPVPRRGARQPSPPPHGYVPTPPPRVSTRRLARDFGVVGGHAYADVTVAAGPRGRDFGPDSRVLSLGFVPAAFQSA